MVKVGPFKTFLMKKKKPQFKTPIHYKPQAEQNGKPHVYSNYKPAMPY